MFSLFMIKLTFGCMHCCRDGIVNSPMNSCSCLIPAYVPNVSLCDTKSTQQSESEKHLALHSPRSNIKKSQNRDLCPVVSLPHTLQSTSHLSVSLSPLCISTKCAQNTLAAKERERKDAKIDPTPEQVFLLCSFFNDILLFFSLIAFD